MKIGSKFKISHSGFDLTEEAEGRGAWLTIEVP
jgi:hypothetical protein